VPTDIGSVVNLTLQTGHTYRFELQAMGSSLSGTLIDLANPGSPLATVSASDSTYASGAAGVIVASPLPGSTSGIDVTFDNLQGQTVPEPSTFLLMALGMACVTCGGRLLPCHPRRSCDESPSA
jgi:hypothetical protein